jgi:hypothetical protein
VPARAWSRDRGASWEPALRTDPGITPASPPAPHYQALLRLALFAITHSLRGCLLFSDNVVVADVLVELPGGSGLIRSDDERFEYCLASDVSSGIGQPVAYQDRYAPGRVDLGNQRSLVGGLLPPGAVSAEVLDERGVRVVAAVGEGAYAAVLERSSERQEPIVCCRDVAGEPVRRPWMAVYPSVRVTDAQEPCAACGAVDYDEYTPFEQWRGGRGSKVDGTNIPNPIVSCRVCGHEEREGTFVTMRSDPAEDKPTRAARIARFRAEHRKREWLANAEVLPTAQFPIYRAAGWPAQLGGRATQNGELTAVTVDHYETEDASVWADEPLRLRISTRHDEYQRDLLSQARTALTHWIPQGRSGGWPELSRAAVTLWLRARDRERYAAVLNAAQSEQLITIDDGSMTAVMLSGPGNRWVAAGTHGELTIIIAADNVEPSSLRLRPISGAQLLGPEPPDA